jgi:hypothetical protein
LQPYFQRSEFDASFYREFLHSRMPERIFDVHVHINLPEHVAAVPPERWKSDWALECGHLFPAEDAYGCAGELFPFCRYRIAAPENIRELREIRQSFPRVSIIIAHFGRSFCPYFLHRGLELFGPDQSGFYFDTSAVISPQTYDLAFERIDPKRILFGTDMPILFWHGRRSWSETEYRNHCREEFSWNMRHEPAAVEEGYTLFLYEQMRAVLDAMDRHGFSAGQKDDVFWGNAERILV